MRLLKALGSLALFSHVTEGTVSLDDVTATSARVTWDETNKAELELNRLDARSRGVKVIFRKII